METSASATISTEQKIKNLQTAIVAVAEECERDGKLYSRDALLAAYPKIRSALDQLGSRIRPSD